MKHLLQLVCLCALLPGTSLVSYGAPIYNPATGHYYEIVEGDWNGAEDNAVALGGNLVTINDQAEQDWLMANFDGHYYWIGFNDVAEEGNWVWSSGEPVTYTHWAPGQPDNAWGGQDYGIIHDLGGKGEWNDIQLIGYATSGIAEYGSGSIPIPASVILLGSGIFGLAALRKKTRRDWLKLLKPN